MSKKRAMMIGLDGADPVVVRRLIDEGKMPNMKKLLEQGVARETLDMMGVLPTITPPNWASIATGNYPRTHGVTCFLNHTLGKSLGITELNWNSMRVESEFIWEAFEDEGKKCIMLNYCEAWPNRVEGSNNIFIDGVGVVPFLRSSEQFQKVVIFKNDYPNMKEVAHTVSQSSGDCVVYKDQVDKFATESDSAPAAAPQGLEDLPEGMTIDDVLAMSSHFGDMPLESPGMVIKGFSAEDAANDDKYDKLFTPIKDAEGWAFEVPEGAKEVSFTMNNSLARRIALFYGDKYENIKIYRNKKADKPLGECTLNTWSAPIFDTFSIDDQDVKVAYYIRGMEMAEDGSEGRFYISHVMNCEDKTYYYPQSIHDDMMEKVGPMCYFANVDRHTPLGDAIELESFDLVNDWHMRATQYLFDTNPDWQLFYIHLHSIDLVNHHYMEQAVEGRHEDWKRFRDVIDEIYMINDKYIGTVLDNLDENTVVCVTSDHAAIPRSAGYENPGIGELSGINAGVMEELGYTVTVPMPGIEGMYMIDWTKTRAINHRTSHIYINLKGRDPEGIVEPEDYDKLVQQIISDLYSYRDPQHPEERVVAFAMTREEMETIGMGGPHCGDIFFQLKKEYGFEHGNSFQYVTNEGYSLGALCIWAGMGLKKGEYIKRPIRNVDIVPTFCHLVGNRQPKDVEGGVIYQLLADEK